MESRTVSAVVRQGCLALRDAETPERTKCDTLKQFKELCFSSQGAASAMQEELTNQGTIDAMIELCGSPCASETRYAAFDCIAELCFRDALASVLVAQNKGFLQHVGNTLASSDGDDDLRVVALTAVINPASNSWECHHDLAAVVPTVIQIINSCSDGANLANAVGRAVIFLNNLAYNPQMASFLESQGAVDALVRIIKHSSSQSVAFIATIGVANLDVRHPIFVTEQFPEVLGELLDAFGHVIHDRPYPPNSNMFGKAWRLARTLGALCTNKQVRDRLVDQGLIALLHTALANNSTSKPHNDLLVESCLFALWHACEE
eukprot:c2551_g1_i1.p1 GENE.c2551_g1_i1~~c2551_g1_i1.p1  ORF type:complete len:319 (-),score=70.68 c2551_g1_i1:285-1241(-)